MREYVSKTHISPFRLFFSFFKKKTCSREKKINARFFPRFHGNSERKFKSSKSNWGQKSMKCKYFEKSVKTFYPFTHQATFNERICIKWEGSHLYSVPEQTLSRKHNKNPPKSLNSPGVLGLKCVLKMKHCKIIRVFKCLFTYPT